MKKVLLRGPVYSKSGYGEHTRQILKYLLSKKIDLKIQPLNWGFTPWYIDETDCDGLIGEAFNRTEMMPEKNFDITIQCQLPNEWDTSYGKYNVGVTAGVETDLCNPAWSSLHVSKMDKVIVPSDFTKSALLSNGRTTTKIEVVPEAYFGELLNNSEYDIFEDKIDTEFNFLTVGVLTGSRPETDRKNLFFLVKWFLEAFKNDTSVGLVIKTNRGRDTTIDRKATFNLLNQVLKELNHDGTPRVYLLHGEMSREEMNSVYKSKKIKGYLSITRGEGFGLPLLEASVAEVPVIATNWSAHTEFLNKGKWTPLSYTLKAVDDQRIDEEIFVKGSKWAEVSEKDFKEKVVKFKKTYKTKKDHAKKLSKILKESHSINAIMKKYDKVLSGVLD